MDEFLVNSFIAHDLRVDRVEHIPVLEILCVTNVKFAVEPAVWSGLNYNASIQFLAFLILLLNISSEGIMLVWSKKITSFCLGIKNIDTA